MDSATAATMYTSSPPFAYFAYYLLSCFSPQKQSNFSSYQQPTPKAKLTHPAQNRLKLPRRAIVLSIFEFCLHELKGSIFRFVGVRLHSINNLSPLYSARRAFVLP